MLKAIIDREEGTMSEELPLELKFIISAEVAKHELVDVSILADKIDKRFPICEIGTIKRLIFEEAVQSGRNIAWDHIRNSN
jgi:hypothetical protein